MSNKNGRFLQLLALSLSITSQLSLSAYGDPASQLKSESASVDASQPRLSEPTSLPQQEEHKTTTLNGAVQKNDSALGKAEVNSPSQDLVSSTQAAGANAINANLQPEVAAKSPLYALALKKLAAKEHLTSDEFRSLGIGILGAEITRPYFQTESKVEDLYPGCPAMLAGMKVGDTVIDQNAAAEDSHVKDPTRPMWMFSCGIEGEKVNFTVKRKGHTLNFQLVRMNMEDVPDPTVRHNYEKMAERLGSSGGTVEVPEPGSSNSNVVVPQPISVKKLLLRSFFGL